MSQLLSLQRIARPLWEARQDRVLLRALPQGLIGVRARRPDRPCFVLAPRPGGARLRASLRVLVQRGSPLRAGLYYGDPRGQRFSAFVVESGTSVRVLEGSAGAIKEGTNLSGRFGLSTLAFEERPKGLHVNLGKIQMTMGAATIEDARAGLFLSGDGEAAFSEFQVEGFD